MKEALNAIAEHPIISLLLGIGIVLVIELVCTTIVNIVRILRN